MSPDAKKFYEYAAPILAGALSKEEADLLFAGSVPRASSDFRARPFPVSLALESRSHPQMAIDLLDRLLQAGVAVDTRVLFRQAGDTTSKTMLHFGVEYGSPELVSRLLALGADLHDPVLKLDVGGQGTFSKTYTAMEFAVGRTEILTAIKSFHARRMVDECLDAALGARP